jgi:hypothetical protein
VKQVTLRRTSMGDHGTFGVLEVDGLKFHTGELPWRDNKRGQSCVPAGTYLVEWDPSPKYGMKYELRNVPARTTILVHAANYVGDEALGYRAQVDGCISLGYKRGELEGQDAILDSKQAVRDFEAHMDKEPFELTIIDEYLEAGDPGTNVA